MNFSRIVTVIYRVLMKIQYLTVTRGIFIPFHHLNLQSKAIGLGELNFR